ncbi:hypothetical protein [Methylobacterium sp. WL120]|uniref:hypothetical protein n=1 Tax=Methylobacterium sp. WL120 TaxID=2603887 RepID=UPI001FEEC57F|nr:hypothetical protein [Methylobacterium sp. WL120]
MAKNEANPLWHQCEARWAAIIDHARHVIAASSGGRAGYRCERVAAQEVVKLADHVAPSDVVVTTLAAFVLIDHQPRLFRSDASFKTQLVRRVRGLTEVNAGSWFNAHTGKTKRAYRELTPRAVMVLAGWLSDALGAVGLTLADMERREHDHRQRERQAMAEALGSLT